ncbi:MAG: hypothetical protein ACRD5H_13200 [Nitrososphaerales archaeon]
MNQFDDYLSYGLMFLGVLFWAVIAINYWRYWRQLQEAFLPLGIKWPPHSQEELNESTRKDLTTGCKMMSTNMFAAARVIFTMRTGNPAIQKPLRGIRRTLLAFMVFPIIFGVALVFVLALTQV